MTGRNVATISIILAGLALASGARAEDYRDEIVVEGRTLSLDKLNAVKTPTPIIDIPQSLSIISEEQIADQAFTSIGDILRYTPGLSVSQGE
ncbi:MAG: TonB-dependent receptor plug domain-containing protein, partial [Parvularculaceae bacterium]